MSINNIHVIVSGAAGAGSSTVANAIAASLKPILKDSRVFNADQDEAPENQQARLDALRGKLNVIIDTQQTMPQNVDYTAQVKAVVNSKRYTESFDWNGAAVHEIVQMVNLAQAVGIEKVESNMTTPAVLFKKLQEWLTKPQKVESLEARQREAGELVGKPWKGKKPRLF